MKTTKISLSDEMTSQLKLKSYEKDYTPIPNNRLPESLKNQLASFYAFVSGGDELPQTDSTYLVKADGGSFYAVYGPTLCRHENALCLRWGKRYLELDLENPNLSLSFSPANTGYKKVQPVDCCVSVVISGQSNYLVTRVYQESLDAAQDANTLNIVYKESPETFYELVGEFEDKTNNNFVTGTRLKASNLPVGQYKVSKMQLEDNFNKTDKECRFQVELTPEQAFKAVLPTPLEKDANGKVTKWGTVEKDCAGLVNVKANKAMVEFFKSGAEVSSDKPATLSVTKHYKTPNGHDAAKVLLTPFIDLNVFEGIDLDF